MKARGDLEVANEKHTTELSLLKEEHRCIIIHLENDKKSMAVKAKKDIEMAHNKHAAEVLRLNEEHRQFTDAITSKFQDEMSIRTRRMQATIDEKSQAIAAQDLRMASYNKQIHGIVSDGDLGHKFRDLSLMIDTLVDVVPRPREYIADTALDPGDFLGRNSSRGSRVWHKFLSRRCGE
ncbi:hypothetical protein GGR58DRAFT_148836 [Xylaria digitata]|nr:hypothetical protein GGR58DRAFT_148836 [Xylaria digitata]